MVYLDHAATSYPKPEAVLEAVANWYSHIGVSADRGDGPRSAQAREVVQQVRGELAKLCGTRRTNVAFVSGATEGLNLALRAVARPDARVLTTVFEHSSIVRVLRELGDTRGLRLQLARSEDDLCTQILAEPPAVVVFTHASNVTGDVFDAARICALAREHGAISVLDVCQTAGYLPLDVDADVVIGSGHKALHGPPGIGFVAVRDGLTLAPQKQGGTGSSSALDRHPTQWPEAFEAGTPNTPAIFGLGAALEWLHAETPTALLQRSITALDTLQAGLAELDGIRLLTPGSAIRMPVLSFVHERYDVLELGSILAASGIHARAGFHCAPWVHRHLGTDAGTLRLSTGPETTSSDVATCLDVLRSL